MPKRLRVFAGPNGSGKTTFVKDFNFPSDPNIKLGVYVNADDIEQTLNQNHSLPLIDLGFYFDTEHIQRHFQESTFSPVKLANKNLWENFTVESNFLIVSKKLSINSYIAADVAEFIRLNLINTSLSFSFETVMSDSKKIDFLKSAKKSGYRIYLYYFSTKDPMINVNRVSLRMAQHGHSVDPQIIESRYYRSLENLKEAVLVSDRAYIFDNSGKASILIAEINEGKNVRVFDPENPPEWFVKYLVEKHQ